MARMSDDLRSLRAWVRQHGIDGCSCCRVHRDLAEERAALTEAEGREEAEMARSAGVEPASAP